jgi:hypothetical protein
MANLLPKYKGKQLGYKDTSGVLNLHVNIDEINKMCKRKDENPDHESAFGLAYHFTQTNLLFKKLFKKSSTYCLSLERCIEIKSYDGSPPTEIEQAHIEKCDRCKKLLDIAQTEKSKVNKKNIFKNNLIFILKLIRR